MEKLTPSEKERVPSELEQVRQAWERSLVGRGRNRVYRYLEPVYSLHQQWVAQKRATRCAHFALKLYRRTGSLRRVTSLRAIIICTSNPDDDSPESAIKLRNEQRKWWRALRAATEVKLPPRTP
jgi:hypothetical protein